MKRGSRSNANGSINQSYVLLAQTRSPEHGRQKQGNAPRIRVWKVFFQRNVYANHKPARLLTRHWPTSKVGRTVFEFTEFATKSHVHQDHATRFATSLWFVQWRFSSKSRGHVFAGAFLCIEASHVFQGQAYMLCSMYAHSMLYVYGSMVTLPVSHSSACKTAHRTRQHRSEIQADWKFRNATHCARVWVFVFDVDLRFVW